MLQEVLALRFQSSHIAGFLAGGLVLTALAAAWSWKAVRETQWESVQEQEIELVMTAIEGGALRFAQLNSARLSSDFLASHFTAASPGATPRFLQASITGGPGGAETYATWSSGARVPASCGRPFRRAFSPPGAIYPYVVTVESNSCWENPVLARLVRSAFLVPIVLSAGLLGVLGSCLLGMMASVRRADRILRCTPDSTQVLALAEDVPWLQVREMVKRALETKGANLHYFQAIIEEAEHDILREMGRGATGRGRAGRELASAEDGVDMPVSSPAVIAGILRKLVHDSKLGEARRPPNEGGTLGALSLGSLEAIAEFLASQGVRAELPEGRAQGGGAPMGLDEEALERLLLNLASNARRHGRPGTCVARVSQADGRLVLVVRNRVSLARGLLLLAAALTGGIDPATLGKPLVRRWFGRQGVGSRIMKKSLEALGASMQTHVSWRSFEARIEVPLRERPGAAHAASATGRGTTGSGTAGAGRGRLAAFMDSGLEAAARLAGLGPLLRPASELQSLVAAGEVAEVMVDFALPDAPESVIVREVKSEARVRGVAAFWQGEAT